MSTTLVRISVNSVCKMVKKMIHTSLLILLFIGCSNHHDLVNYNHFKDNMGIMVTIQVVTAKGIYNIVVTITVLVPLDMCKNIWTTQTGLVKNASKHAVSKFGANILCLLIYEKCLKLSSSFRNNH